MSAIVRRTFPGYFPSLFNDVDPFRVMESLLRNSPEAAQRGLEFAPGFDVKETKDAFLFKADLPGVKEEDLDMTHAGNRLSISGKRDAEERKEGENFFMLERTFGSFQRTFTLPESADVERIRADLTNGVLNITIPKRVAAQPRKVALGTSEAK